MLIEIYQVKLLYFWKNLIDVEDNGIDYHLFFKEQINSK